MDNFYDAGSTRNIPWFHAFPSHTKQGICHPWNVSPEPFFPRVDRASAIRNRTTPF